MPELTIPVRSAVTEDSWGRFCAFLHSELHRALADKARRDFEEDEAQRRIDPPPQGIRSGEGQP